MKIRVKEKAYITYLEQERKQGLLPDWDVAKELFNLGGTEHEVVSETDRLYGVDLGRYSTPFHILKEDCKIVEEDDE